MSSEVSTKKQSTNRRKIVAGLAALGIGMAGYGVYATTLTVAGSAGTKMQAGNSAPVTPTAACDANGVTVTENFSTPALNATNGYSDPARTGFTITDISDTCSGLKLYLAIKTTGDYTAVNVEGDVLDGSGTVTVADTGSGSITGYSVKIA